MIGHIPSTERRAAIISISIGVLLLAIKFIAYFVTRSSAVFSDAMESIVNVAASIVAAYSLYVAHAPADREHPYGHGKAEFLSAGFEGGMVLLAAIVIFLKTVDTLLFHEVSVQELNLGLALIAAAMLANGAVGLYLIRTGKRQSSLTLEADGWHLLTDAITSVATLAALLVVRTTGWVWADPIAALLIAAYIAWMGARLFRRAAAGLMDEQDLADERLLHGILDSHVGPTGREPRICSFHKLRHRHSGRYHWVDFHIMVPAGWTIDQGHAVASAVEYEIEQALGEAKATAHVEPCAEVPCVLASSGAY